MFSEHDKTQIPVKYRQLLKSCKKFLNKEELPVIRKAYDYVLQYFDQDKMDTGEMYMFHAVNVAIIVVKEIGLSKVSVVSALLHNIVRKKEVSIDHLRNEFGDQVADILENLNKLSRLSTSKASLNIENFIKLQLTFTNDVRIILIRLADRLDFMRNLDKLPETERIYKAKETSLLYVPIAHRIGLYNIKTELEELSMKYSFPEIYAEIEGKLKETKLERDAYIKVFSRPIIEELDKLDFKYHIASRIKSIASIWKKMKSQNVDFSEVYDIFAIRIIIDSETENEKADCWKVYSLLTNLYLPNPKRLRDWLTTPKVSGYESLHTTVLGQGNHYVEIQIRSKRMDKAAEKGGAAHWKYKESDFTDDTDLWLNMIRDMLENPKLDKLDASGMIKLDLVSDKIFVFTPNGDIKKISAGATVLDFAFEIHSNIGSSCTGAKVNDKIVPLKHVISNGDKVEILTSKNQKPKADWLNFITTSRAKSKIKRAVKELQFKEADEGKEILMRKMGQLKIPFNNNSLNKLKTYFNISLPIELFQNIADNKIELSEVKKCFFPEVKEEESSQKITEHKEETLDKADIYKPDDLLLIDGKTDLKSYNFAKCCNPVYGDSIFGFVTVEKGIKIHRTSCPNAKQLKERYPYRIIQTKWSSSKEGGPFTVTVQIIGSDELGIVNSISNFITSYMRINMRSFQFNTKKERFEGLIKLYVKDSKQLDFIMANLLKIKGIEKIKRIN